MRFTDSAIRALDPADAGLSEAQRARADALLERIVAGEAAAPARRRAAIGWRIAGALVATAAVTAAIIVVPGLGRGSAAVASWTAEPSVATAADLRVAEAACRSTLRFVDDIDQVPLALAERRGDVLGLLFWRENPELAVSCLVVLPLGAEAVSEVHGGSGGSSGPAVVPPAGTVIEGAVSQDTIGGSPLSMVNGGVGENVVGVTIHSGELTAEATVADGRYTAWLPGAVFSGIGQPSGRGGPEVTLSYDLELSDGTVLTNVEPYIPR